MTRGFALLRNYKIAAAQGQRRVQDMRWSELLTVDCILSCFFWLVVLSMDLIQLIAVSTWMYSQHYCSTQIAQYRFDNSWSITTCLETLIGYITFIWWILGNHMLKFNVDIISCKMLCVHLVQNFYCIQSPCFLPGSVGSILRVKSIGKSAIQVSHPFPQMC